MVRSVQVEYKCNTYAIQMNMFKRKKRLAERLALDARRAGICREWHDELLSMDDKHAMVDMYLRGIDFCLSNDYPTNDFIGNNFKGIMEDHGVFLDEAMDVRNFRKVVALGASHGNARYDNFTVAEVFVKHQSDVWVYAMDNAFVVVDVFDDATVHVSATGNAKVCVNRYGGTVDRITLGNAYVKVREKNKKTY